LGSHVSKALAASAAFAAILLSAPCAMAVTFLVDSNLDKPDDLTMPGTCHTDTGTCTLRAAVMQANLTSGAGATITLPAGTYKLTIPASGADGVEVGDLDIYGGNPTIAIAGAGASTTIIDANQIDRAFHVHAGRSVTISGVTIQNGFTSNENPGGGIQNEGSLTLDHLIVKNNHSDEHGGAVDSSGTLTVTNSIFTLNHGNGVGGGIRTTGDATITNSTISQGDAYEGGGIYSTTGTTTTVINSTINNNSATLRGGGIKSDGTLVLTRSTVNNNDSAGSGGGIFLSGTGYLSSVNSTISQNNATVDGGGIYNYGGADIFNTTIFFNGADAAVTGVGRGGGIYNNDSLAITNIRNTLIVGNYVSNSPTYRDCFGTVSTYGKNLYWDATECTFVAPGASISQLNSLSSVDSVLRNNGGPTLTHALLAGSNAIDGGDPDEGCIGPGPVTLATDQRGFPRVAGARCDIGAYELSDTIFVSGFE